MLHVENQYTSVPHASTVARPLHALTPPPTPEFRRNIFATKFRNIFDIGVCLMPVPQLLPGLFMGFALPPLSLPTLPLKS